MGPVTYVGRETSFKGKRLFDILCRLKNFGVGRIVYRHVFHERYPEPSYFVITKVRPDMSDPTGSASYTNLLDKQKTKGVAIGMEVFRGENKGEQVIKSGFKADWRLVPREEEDTFFNRQCEPRAVNVVPTHIPFPPLFEHFMMENMRKSGNDVSKAPLLPLIIKKGADNRAIQKDEESFLQDIASQ